VTPRRELQAAIAFCLLGALLILVALSRTWVSTKVPSPPPLPARRLELRGHHFVGSAQPLALVGLAGVAALAATRKTGRVLVGLLVGAAGIGVVAAILHALVDTSVGLGGWPYAAIAGGGLLVAAGALVVVRGRSWSSMSARYDAPVQKPPGEASLWDALDRGEDPTDQASHRGG
jgi:hypothetical protein